MTTANIQIRQVLFKRGNTTAAANYTGPVGTIVIDTGLNTIRIQDGVTAGGFPIAQGIRGLQGNAGAQGTQGLQGNAGAQGPQGIQGIQGNTGAQGTSVTLVGNVATPAGLPESGSAGQGYIVNSVGNLYIWNTITTSWNDVGPIVGPQGIQGAQGIQGNAGAQGIQGIQGNAGAQGIQGIQGNVGATGTVDYTLLAPINANIAAANAAIVTANTSLKSYTDTAISTAINNLINSAPGTLDTLSEIAANLATSGGAIASILTSITTTNSNVTTANTGMKSYVDAQITTLTSNSATQASLINSLRANVTAANSAIQTISANLGAYQTYGNLTFSTVANAGTQQTEINALRANITAANTLVYGNSNVSSYLSSYDGSINFTASPAVITGLGNISSANFTFGNGVNILTTVSAGNLNIGGNLVANVNISSLSNRAYSVGYLGIPQNTQAANYGILIGDAGRHIYVTSTSTVTIPANSSVAFPIGTAISIIAATGVTVTIAITTDTMYLAGTGTTGSRTLAAFGMATAVKVTSTAWFINGTGLT